MIEAIKARRSIRHFCRRRLSKSSWKKLCGQAWRRRPRKTYSPGILS